MRINVSLNSHPIEIVVDCRDVCCKPFLDRRALAHVDAVLF
jgi:hypothetical protein